MNRPLQIGVHLKTEALVVSKTLKQRICCKVFGVRDQARVSRVKRPRVNSMTLMLPSRGSGRSRCRIWSGEPNKFGTC